MSVGGSLMKEKYVVAFEFDRREKYERYGEQIERLEKDGRFECRYLRTPASPPSHHVSAEELKGVDFYILMGHRHVDDAALEGTDLTWIGRFGAGFENVDISACTRHHVLLSNSPNALWESVAETAFTFMLALTVRLPFFTRYIQEHKFEGKGLHSTRYLKGQTLGLLASGGIAQRLA